MAIKTIKPRKSQNWIARYNGNTGQVELASRVKRGRCFTQWGMTYDPTDPNSWFANPIDPTLKATTVVSNLTVGKVAYFRYRSILKDGPSPWSDILKIMVV
jgi:hypothetical protein